MDPIQKILVCLDLTEIDPVLVRYAANIAPQISAETLFFLHVIQAYDLPGKSGKHFQDDEKDLSRAIYQSLADQVADAVPESMETEILIDIAEEDAANGILQRIDDLDADLVIIGQKPDKDRQGHYGKKIMADCKCDTLLIPADANQIIDKILCCLDFSKDSEKGFSRALDFQKKFGSSLVCYYLHDRTSAYFPASTKKSADANRKKAKKQYQEFMDRFDIAPGDIPCRIQHMDADSNTDEGVHICDAANDEHADMIIVGAAGDSGKVTTLLGHIAESLRREQKHLPVMIVKNAKSSGFF